MYNLDQLVLQWDRLSDAALRSGDEYADIDCLHWFNYLAFDIIGDLVSRASSNSDIHRPLTQIMVHFAIYVLCFNQAMNTGKKVLCDGNDQSGSWTVLGVGDLCDYHAYQLIWQAFGAPFNMLPKGADIAEVRKRPDSPPSYAAAITVLNRRGEVSSTIGCLPALKPYAKYMPDPFFRNGVRAVENLAGIAVARVNARLDAPDHENGGRKDLLSRLMEGRDETGEKLGRAELTAEALTQLIAGSDTTSNTSCAGLYWILKTPGVMERLEQELDKAVSDDVVVPDFELVKDIP